MSKIITIRRIERCTFKGCKYEAYTITGIGYARYCCEHLVEMEKLCIYPGCEETPWYGPDGFIWTCENHKGKDYKLSRDEECYYGAKTRKLCNELLCSRCYYKSFDSHPKSEFWSPSNELKPRQATRSSGKKFSFNCYNCNHTFAAGLNKVSSGRWCCFCASKKLCNNMHCDLCYEKSFASHNKSIYWNILNNINPRFVFKCSPVKYLFNCPCGHTIECRLDSISNGQWCGFCASSPKHLCDNLDCLNC